MTTIYGSDVSNGTLSTASTMSSTTGGTEVSQTTTVTGTLVWVEVLSRAATIASVSSIGSPSGKGWVFAPGAGTFALGNWSASVTLQASAPGTTDITIRFYKYSGGSYTSIGTINKTGVVGTKTTYSFAATSMSAVTFGASDLLYVDLWWHDTSGADDNPIVFESNSATAGVANDMQVTTSTFTAGSTVSRTVPATAALIATLSRTITSTAALQSTNSRTVPSTAALSQAGIARTIPATAAIANTKSRTVPATVALTNSGTRTIPATASLTGTFSRTIPTTAALVRTLTRTIPATASFGTTNSRTIPAAASLTKEIASGGITLFANGTGVASFVNFRATQYPDSALSLARVLPRLGTSNVAWNDVVPTNTSDGVKTSINGVNFSTATSGNAVPGLNGQADPVIDIFDGTSTTTYTNTSKSGGSVATVTLDTANKRLTLAGGSGALYLNSSILDDDIDLICDMDRSDAGGLVWRFVDASNFYELGAYDDSASGGFTNQLRLYKVLAGTRSLLGSASVVTWYRNTPDTSPYKRIRVTMLSGTITVYFDGVQVQTYTDGSPLAAGKIGLRNDGGTSRYYQLRAQVQGDYVSGTPAGDVVTGKFVYSETTLNTTDPSVSAQQLDLTLSARSPKIATGALIPQLHDPSKPDAVVFNAELDTIAQASGDFYSNVDKDAELTFNARMATPAPFCLHSTDLVNDPQVLPTNAADLYRNQMIINNTIGITDVQHEEKVADGSASSWNMGIPLYSAPEVTVGGVVKTVGVQGVDTGRDFYWQYGSVAIGQDSSASKISSGYILTFDYIGQFPDRVIRNNLAEQAARKLVEKGTSGIVVAIEDGGGMLSSNAIVYADGLLDRHKNNDTTELICTTRRAGLEAGMILPTFIPEHHLQNRQMLILKVSTMGYLQSDGSTLYEYTLDITDGPNLSRWASVFGI